MKTSFAIINDALVNTEEASIYINDLALQRGYGVFDFFRTVNGNFLFLDDHLERLYNSATFMRLPLQKSKDEFKSLLNELNNHNNIPDSGIRITLTGGYNHDGYTITTPNIIVTQQALTINADNAGIKLCTYAHQRQLSHIKTIDYLMAIWLKPFVAENNADDVLYEQSGIVTECPRANFFIVTHNNEVFTPAKNMLKGIMRKKVLEISGKHFKTEEKDVTITDILNAREAFITSSTKEILPVTQVNGKQIGNGSIGGTTSFLRDELREIIYKKPIEH